MLDKSELIVDSFAGGGGASLGISDDRLREKVVEFWRNVAVGKPDECWIWLGSRNKRPDGSLSYGTIGIRKHLRILAHRFAFMVARGPIADGHVVCHRCDNVGCVNPQHLFSGTQRDNLSDMRRKGRGHINKFKSGTDHPFAKINEEDVRRIRMMRKEGVSFAKIGAAFYLHPSTVFDIVNNKIWSHVSDSPPSPHAAMMA